MNLSLLRVGALVSLLGLLAGTGMAQAVEVTGLFDAAVPVANQGNAERVRAMAEGFRQVLVKASGQRSVLSNPAIAQELGKAESLLGSYRYETATARTESTRAGAPDAAAGATRIRLAFDPGSVLAILNRGAAPVWSASRPQVYLWVVREGPARTLAALGTPQADVLLDSAGLRGLPVAVPAPGDVSTLDAVTTAVPSAVLGVAARVGAQVVLAAAVAPAGGKVRASGFLRVDGIEQRIEVVGSDESEALRELVAQAADALGARCAVVARQDQLSTVRLRVDGVGSLAAWAALERWLASQPLVKDAALGQVDGTTAEFTLALAGDIERLLQAMRADGRFLDVGKPVVDGAVVALTATLSASPGQ